MENKLKIVFFGTPEFAVKPLAALYESGEEIAAVVTSHDKKMGRKQILTPSAVKAYALEKGIKVLEYTSVRKEGAEDLRALGADVFVTCAFGQILSEEILAIPKYYTLNIHGSLLPKYRGASPIQSALLAGEKKTGVTIMKTAFETDAGDILFERETDIGEDENAGDLFVRLSALGAECILQAVALVKSGKAAFTPQNAAEATFCKKIAKEDGLIDFSLPAEEIACRVRAFEPWPCAYTFVRGAQLKIHRAKAAAGEGNPGEVLRADKALEIACGKGSLIVEEVTPQGSRRMSAADYARGGKIAAGDAVGGC